MSEIKHTLMDEMMTFKFPARLLTKKQKQYLEYIEAFYRENHQLPTYQQIATFFGKSRATVFQALNCHGIHYNSRVGVRIYEAGS
jgi:predicted DNA-binding protein YlxM (UPF0122 family)